MGRGAAVSPTDKGIVGSATVPTNQGANEADRTTGGHGCPPYAIIFYRPLRRPLPPVSGNPG
jgi:hypothetical protein